MSVIVNIRNLAVSLGVLQRFPFFFSFQSLLGDLTSNLQFVFSLIKLIFRISMRGKTFFSYALVAFATTAYAAPLAVQADDLEARTPYVVDGKAFVGKVRIVNVGEEFVQRREDKSGGAAVDAAAP
jgi:hypothetical protein